MGSHDPVEPVGSSRRGEIGLVTGVLIVTSLWFVAAMLAIGTYVGTLKRGTAYWCLTHYQSLPSGEVMTESVDATGSWSLVPLGIQCQFTLPSGESYAVGPDLAVTVLAGIALLGTLILVALFVRLRPSLRAAADARTARTRIVN
ncbi:MAG: hypothetical protein WBX17_07550 [Microbacterium sp.]